MHLLLPLRVLPFHSRVAKSLRLCALVPSWLKPRPCASFFQDHDSDLLRVQPADPESSGRADMARRQRLGRPRAGASGGVHSEATTGYARTRIRAVTNIFRERAREHIMEIRCFSRTQKSFEFIPARISARASIRGDVKPRAYTQSECIGLATK